MNATKKLAALVVACIMVAAVSVPIVYGDTASSGATVSGEAPVVEITSITPDPADPGDTVTVSGTLSDPNVPGHSSTQLEREIDTFQYIVYEPDGATEYATGTITVDFDWSFAFDLGTGAGVGEWSVKVTATDKDGLSDTYTKSFAVNEAKSYVIDFATVAFGIATIDEKVTVEGNTIMNTGNVPMDVTISATDMTGEGSGDNTIAKENLGAAVGTAAEQDLGEVRTFAVGIAPDKNAAIDFTLTAPTGTAADIYSGTITVEGV